MAAVVAAVLAAPAVQAQGSVDRSGSSSATADLGPVCPDDEVVERRFADVQPDSAHVAAIDCMAWWTLLAGDADGSFRPAAAVTRGELASILARTMRWVGRWPERGPDAFDDDDGSVHADSIDRLAARGAARGVEPRRYAPDAGTTRAQAAVLVLRALTTLPDAGGPGDGSAASGAKAGAFVDDDADPLEPELDRAAEIGLLLGRPGGVVDPSAPLRRDALASLLARFVALSGTMPPAAHDLPPFYDVPDPLPPASPGTVIASEEITGIAGGRAWRVLYHSRSIAGDDIAVSGTVAVPAGDPPTGGWPVVTWGHGTRGVSDCTAPSLAGAHGAGLVERGYAVVASDYEGLGTPGVHTYLVGESAARSMLDIVRAARHLDPAIGRRVAAYGWSQGGHAALFTGQLASSWAAELELVGTIAMAPGTELQLLYPLLASGSGFSGYLVYAAAGMHAAYAHAPLEAVVTTEAVDLLAAIDRGCEFASARLIEAPVGELVTVDPAVVEPWATIIRDNNPGGARSGAPVLLLHGSADATIPPVATELLLRRMCEHGDRVQRIVYEGGGHDVFAESEADRVAWLADRFAGEAAGSDCGR